MHENKKWILFSQTCKVTKQPLKQLVWYANHKKLESYKSNKLKNTSSQKKQQKGL
jgi:hypothetical protein